MSRNNHRRQSSIDRSTLERRSLLSFAFQIRSDDCIDGREETNQSELNSFQSDGENIFKLDMIPIDAIIRQSGKYKLT